MGILAEEPSAGRLLSQLTHLPPRYVLPRAADLQWFAGLPWVTACSIGCSPQSLYRTACRISFSLWSPRKKVVNQPEESVGFWPQQSAAPGGQPAALSLASDLPIRLIVICENMPEIRRSARIDSATSAF